LSKWRERELKKEQKLKERLERSLYNGYREITADEWGYLKNIELISAYESESTCENEEEKFDALKESVSHHLKIVQHWFDPSRERGEFKRTSESSDNGSKEFYFSEGFDGDEHTFGRGEAVHSRGQAILTYERLRANKDDDEIRPIFGSAAFLGEGVRGGVPQWIVLIQAQAWTPANQIKEHYQWVQDYLSHERGWKTRARSFDVVRFVWEIELARGERPSWPELTRIWNESRPKNEAFARWRSFYKCFSEAKPHVLPRYRHDDDQLRKMIDSGSQVIAFDRWAEEFRRHL
jgi:hypothetical protein